MNSIKDCIDLLNENASDPFDRPSHFSLLSYHFLDTSQTMHEYLLTSYSKATATKGNSFDAALLSYPCTLQYTFSSFFPTATSMSIV